MAGAWKLTLNRAGIGNLLKSDAAASMVNRAAERGAAAARGALPGEYRDAISVEQYTTDRGAAAVGLSHPGASGIEAKYGPLSRASSAVGGEYRAG